MRLIDADILLDRVEWANTNPLLDHGKTAVELIKNAPTIEERKWIPCRERLPEEEDKYLCVCSLGGEMCVLSFYKNLYAYDRYDFERYKGTIHPGFIEYDSEYGDYEVEVLAWMPLPESYSCETKLRDYENKGDDE